MKAWVFLGAHGLWQFVANLVFGLFLKCTAHTAGFQSSRFGVVVYVSFAEDGTLMVIKILSGGLIQQWNEDCTQDATDQVYPMGRLA
eukprot:5360004-Amphidinium_carterae.1